jgi:hypothetical protein
MAGRIVAVGYSWVNLVAVILARVESARILACSAVIRGRSSARNS